ncbi:MULTISPECIES: DJ-1/PfpI family protein [Pseudomonas]|uniref:DJ-1/PfpI family protein n=1 Tax=Pseudomonas lutea TaxID=243924 RepID=A0A9X8MGP6_9PSED|nr:MULTISPECIES: DJ-1/PfpI family protein [Pseudomonas]SER29589.1 DJ-1/PfpI family protein [Pseudomonas lutea]
MSRIAAVSTTTSLLPKDMLDIVSFWRQAGHETCMFSCDDQAPLAHIDPVEFDALAVLGSSDTLCPLGYNELLWDSVQGFDAIKKTVAGIGTGALVLAHAGLLVGKRATCNPTPAVIADLKLHGALYSNESPVVAGWIVTATRGGTHSFAEAVLNNLAVAKAPHFHLQGATQ